VKQLNPVEDSRLIRRDAILLLYDAAIPLLKATRMPPLWKRDVDRVFCLGYPTLAPTPESLELVSARLGVPVERWPHDLSEEEIATLFEALSRRSDQIELNAPRTGTRIPWWRLKANERVYYRMMPFAKVEAMLSNAFSRGLSTRLIVPWLARSYDLVERSGMLGLDAPAHQFSATLERLRNRHSFDVSPLWPDTPREGWMLPAARIAMTAARLGILAGRSVRDAWNSRPGGKIAAPKAQQGPPIGFLVGGASQWSSLQPLLAASHDDYHPVVFTYDIFRNPTAYRALVTTGAPFIPLDSVLGLPRTLMSLSRGTQARRRLRDQLRRRAEKARSTQDREEALLLASDVESLVELDLFVEQVRCSIRKHRLCAVFSANNIDSYLGAITEACRAEGVPHLCIHNTAIERVRLPALADCDLYVSDSAVYAEFMRENGALGAVEALGLPYYDKLVNRLEYDQPGAILEAFPHLRGRRIVGVTTQTEWIDFRPVLTPLIQWAEANEELAIVVKLHPRESPNAYSDLRQRLEWQGRGGFLHHVPLESFLADCEFLVGGASTTLFWAIIMGVRPFSWVEGNIRLMASGLDYLRNDVTTSFESPADVLAAIRTAVRHPEEAKAWRERRMRFIEDCLTGADGRACSRILSRLEEFLQVPNPM
jgi:hypothetical protein